MNEVGVVMGGGERLGGLVWEGVGGEGYGVGVVDIERENGVVFREEGCVGEGEEECGVRVVWRRRVGEMVKLVNEVGFGGMGFIVDWGKVNCGLWEEGLRGKWGVDIGGRVEKEWEGGLVGKDVC